MKRTRLFTIIAVLLFWSLGNASGQTQIYSYGFETYSSGNPEYSTSVSEGTDNNKDYFTRTDGNNIGSSVSLTGITGSYYFAAQDIDGIVSGSNQTLTITGINISGYTNLELRVDLAEDDDGSNEDWDASDFVHFGAQIDNGGYSDVLNIENDGSTNNSEPSIDRDFDGDGDGSPEVITDAFTQRTASISGTGSTLDIEIEFELNSGDEDIAIDEIQVYGTPSGPDQPQTFTASPVSSTQNDLTYQSNAAGNNVVIIFDTDNTFTTPSGAPTGTTLGGGTILVNASAATSTTYNHTGLSNTNTYYYRAYSYDGSDYSIALSEQATPIKPEPTTQASGISFSNIGASSVDLSWTRGDGDSVLVLMNSSNSFTNPTDGATPGTANTTWQNSGEQTVFTGNGNAVSIDGLSTSTTYHFRVYEYTNSGANTDYLTSTATDNPNSVTTISSLTETFTNIGSSGSYGTRTWSGDNGNGTWTATDAREDRTVNGKAITVRNGDLTSPSITGGIGSLTLTTERQFSGGSRNLTVKVNGVNVGTIPYSATQQTNSITGINTTGSFTLEIETPSNGDRIAMDDLTWTGFSNQPEIDIQGNGTDIANSQTATTTADNTDFGPVFNDGSGGESTTSTFYIKNTGTATLNLTGSNPVSFASGGTGFSITQPASSAIAVGDSVGFDITFDPSTTGNASATVSVASNDADENPFTFDIIGEGSNRSALSDIEMYGEADNTNTAYINFLNASNTNATGKVTMAKFRIRDGGSAGSDADNFSTELNSISFSVENLSGNNRIDVIETAVITGTGGAFYAGLDNTSGNTLNFNTLSGSNFQAADDNTQDLHLRVSFDPSQIVDNEKLVFAIASASADPTTSIFAAADAGGDQTNTSSASDLNRVEVDADRLRFVSAPSSVIVNAQFSAEVEAVDAQDNRDLDETASVSLSRNAGTGTLSGTLSQNLSSGLAGFTNLQYDLAETGITLDASATNLTTATSSAFDATAFSYQNNDWRPTSATATLSNSDWEIYDNTTGNFNNASNSPQSGSPSRLVINRDISTGTLTSQANFPDIVVISGAALTIEDEDVTVTGDLTVQNGADLIIDYGTAANDDGIWNGTEVFEDGSRCIIQNWNYAGATSSESIVQLSPQSHSPNSSNNNYVFSNLIIHTDGLAAGDELSLVGGSASDYRFVSDTMRIVRQSGTDGMTVMASNANSDSIIFGGDIVLDNAELTMISAFSSSATSLSTHVMGDITVTGSNGELKTFENIGASASSTSNPAVYLEGNLNIASNSSFTNEDQNARFYFTGTGTQLVDVQVAAETQDLRIENGATVQLQNNLNLNGSDLTVQNGATLDFGLDGVSGYQITETGSSNNFTLSDGGSLVITHEEGIDEGSPHGGNVTLGAGGRKSFSTTGNYIYRGAQNQNSGNGLPTGSSAKDVTIELANATDVFTLDQQVGITGTLTINSGIVDETATEYFDGGGNLTMTGGEYRVERTGVTVPQQGGTITLDGGLLVLDGAGPQTLNGAVSYHNLTLSGSGTKTISSAISGLDETLTVTGTAQLDLPSAGISGSGDLVMDGGRIRFGTGGTQPELTGNYQLTGGTLEFTGSSDQSIRSNREYFNVEVNDADPADNDKSSSDMTIKNGGSLTIQNGDLFASGTITLQGNATFSVETNGSLTPDGELTVTGGSVDLQGNAAFNEDRDNGHYLVGEISGMTRNIAANGTAVSFDGLGISLTAANNSPAPGDVTIDRVTGTALTGNGNNAASQYFDINATTNTGLDVTVEIEYNDQLLNSISESNLELFKSDDGGNTWTTLTTTRNTSSNTLTASGVNSFSIIAPGDQNSPLPVELTDFDATWEGRSVHLNWNTASERNNQGFYVERSRQGELWRPLTFVSGQGTTHQPSAYEWYDRNLPTEASSWFYRLQQIDFDGTTAYSPIIRVQRPSETAERETAALRAFIGPDGNIYIDQTPTADPVAYRWRLINTMGVVLQEGRISLQESPARTAISTKTLPAGLYGLHVEDGHNIRMLRLLVP